MKNVSTFLAFEKNAQEAVHTYVNLFDEVFGDSEVLHTTTFSENEIDALSKHPDMSENSLPGRPGDASTIRFKLNGEEMVAINGGDFFGKFNESVSLYVACQVQGQIDSLWAELSKDGVEQPCGWVKDRFGVSWQIVPDFVMDVSEGDDRERAMRQNVALFEMKKVDLETLKQQSDPPL